MASGIVPPPYGRPMTDNKGLMTAEWRAFFRDFFIRIGGTSALTNQELEDLPALELAALAARVTTTESDISAIQTVNTSQTTTLNTHTTQIQGLGVGPVL